MNRIKIQGLALALSGAAFATVFDLLTRFSSSGITPWTMLMARAVFGIVLVMFIAKKMNLTLIGRNRAGMLITGIITVAGVMCLTIALIRLPIFEALLLLYLYPAFAALFSPFLVGDKTTLKLWGLIGVAFVGTAIILWPGETALTLHTGHAFGMGAGLLQGLALTLVRLYSRDNNALTPFFYFCLAGFVVAAGALVLIDRPPGLNQSGLMVLAAIALTAALAQLSLCKALSCISSAEVGLIGMTEIVFGSILGFLIFQEAILPRQLVGGVLVIGSGLFLVFDKASAKDELRRRLIP